jgi:hypothetical protein
MVCGIVDSLMLRRDDDFAELAFEKPHVRPMDFTGRPMKSMVYVDPPGLQGPALRGWVEKAAAHASTLPPKKGH